MGHTCRRLEGGRRVRSVYLFPGSLLWGCFELAVFLYQSYTQACLPTQFFFSPNSTNHYFLLSLPIQVDNNSYYQTISRLWKSFHSFPAPAHTFIDSLFGKPFSNYPAWVCPLFLARLLLIHFPWTIFTSHSHLLGGTVIPWATLEATSWKWLSLRPTWDPGYHHGAENCFSPPFTFSLCCWIYFTWVRNKLILLCHWYIGMSWSQQLGLLELTQPICSIWHSWWLSAPGNSLCLASMTLHSSSFPSTSVTAPS